MQLIDDSFSGEDELIRLLLKRQSELNSLLEITRAINKNASTGTLVQMLEVIMNNYLQVGRFRFLLEKDKGYTLLSKYGGTIERPQVIHEACLKLNKIRTPESIKGHAHPLLKSYDYFIPIYQKSKALAFVLIGDFKTTPEMVGNDLSYIQTLVNVIVVALQNKDLFKERLRTERFQREMELAAEVQNMLVPVRSHKEKSVEIGAKYLPHQNIGGDYFDFIRLSDHEFLWCIADVSGKGMPAALLMSNFQASLHAWASVEHDLTNIVERLNKKVVSSTNGERFITVFIAKYDERTRKLNYINAGHNPTILYHDGTAIPLKLGTTMIGAFDELPFINEGEIDVEPDTLVVNYTDGLLDFDLNSNKVVWNEDTLIDFVMANHELSPDAFNNAVFAHLQQNVKGKAIDDITLLTLRIF